MYSFRLAALLILLLTTSQPLIGTSSALLSSNYAAQDSTEAEEAVAEAYLAVLLAEDAGADVSTLMLKLNEAGDYLSKSRQLSSASDLDEAIRLAGEIQSEATDLKETARSLNLQHTMLTMITSIVAIVLIVIGSILLWGHFKDHHSASLPEARLDPRRGTG
jgi:hypothetical protein